WSPIPASPKQVQPSPGESASACRAAATPAGSTRKKIAWWTTSAFCGRNWLPVRYADVVSPGSTRKQRYSSVPPFGAAGVYGCGMVTVTNRSPCRKGAAGGAEKWCPACTEPLLADVAGGGVPALRAEQALIMASATSTAKTLSLTVTSP